MFWRARASFVEALDVRENFYEANVLVWSALDAMAALWALCLHPPLAESGRARRRMGDFLAQHGGEDFQRVSLPALWARSDALPLSVPPTIRDRLRQSRGRRGPNVLEERQARIPSDDPHVVEVLADLADIEAAVVKKGMTVRDLVLAARFGEIAYVEMRCGIVHEGRLGAGAHGFDFGNEAPTYLSGPFGVPPSIGFSPQYMVKVIRACIDGFEREADAAGANPAPPPRGCIVLDLDDEL